MKLFISWSGDTSQQIAQQLRDWVPLILPAVKPFITTTDIDKGARWQGEISRELEQSNYGIVCLTSDNRASQWLAFEAGALSKHLSGRVATILFGLEQADVPPPLNMFQGTRFNVVEMGQLISNIDKAVADENRRGDAQLDKLFPMMWEKLEEPVNLILKSAKSGESRMTARPDSAQEMMALLRQQNAVLASPERFLAPVLENFEKLADLINARTRPRTTFLGGPPMPPPSFLGTAAAAVNKEQAKQYQRNADQCLKLAAKLDDSQSKAALTAMAELWMRLAESKLRTSNDQPDDSKED